MTIPHIATKNISYNSWANFPTSLLILSLLIMALVPKVVNSSHLVTKDPSNSIIFLVALILTI